MDTNQTIHQSVEQWLDDVVIGLNLCPFAAKPRRLGQIRIVESDATEDMALFDALQQELSFMKNVDETKTDTSLLVIPNHLQDFDDYNQFLDLAELCIQQMGLTGVFQIASFHPDYQFAGTEPEDRENLTNRSPYPMLHIIREQSLSRAIKNFANPENIPETNMERMRQLTQNQLEQLFPFL